MPIRTCTLHAAPNGHRYVLVIRYGEMESDTGACTMDLLRWAGPLTEAQIALLRLDHAMDDLDWHEDAAPDGWDTWPQEHQFWCEPDVPAGEDW